MTISDHFSKWLVKNPLYLDFQNTFNTFAKTLVVTEPYLVITDDYLRLF